MHSSCAAEPGGQVTSDQQNSQASASGSAAAYRCRAFFCSRGRGGGKNLICCRWCLERADTLQQMICQAASASDMQRNLPELSR